jgi:hypothetical protein
MARDAAGNFYITDFWGKGIVKLNKDGGPAGFIATLGRPSAVAVLPDNRLVVAMAAPQAYVAFYNQFGSAPNVTGQEGARFGTTGTGYTPIYRPNGVAVDAAGFIYVLDAGDNSTGTTNVPKVRVYDSTGAYVPNSAFGSRTPAGANDYPIGYFKQPAGIFYEKQNNQIVVADRLNGRLQFFGAWNGTACVADKIVGHTSGMNGGAAADGSPVLFGDPTDLAVEYSGTALSRLYVTDRARNEIVVVDAVSPYNQLKRFTVTDMKLPSGLAFETTAAGKGVLYTNSVATSAAAAGVLALSIDGGAVAAGPALVLNAVPDTVASSTLSFGGTNDNYAVTCSVNGTAIAVNGTSTWNTAVNATLVPGSNSIVCQSSNGTATTIKSATTYYVATPANPAVTIVEPAAGLYTQAATVTVSGTSDTAGATITLTNGSHTESVVTNAAKTWSKVVTLDAGSNLITATATKQGMGTGTATVTVVKDNAAPAITVASLNGPTNNTTNNAVQNFDGIVDEANLDRIEVNGSTVTSAATVALGGTSTYFSVPVTLVRGSNTITVTAIDLAGNSSTVNRTVVLNPELAGLSVDLPAGNSFVKNATSAAASGSAAASISSVDAAGAPVTLAGGLWNTTADFAIDAGIKAYLFTASDGVNTVTEKRTILKDAAYSQLAITSPPADLATKNVSVVISGNVAAGSAEPTLAVSGSATIDNPIGWYTQASGAFSFTVTFPTEGVYSVKVTSGTTTAVRNIIYDTTPPELVLQADSKATPTTISGVLEPSAKISAISAKLNSAPISIPLSVITYAPYNPAKGVVSWQADMTGKPYDAESLTFTAVDPAGNAKDLVYISFLPTGDIDGDGVVRLSDALAALRHVSGTETLTGAAFKQGDVGSLVDGHAGRDGVVDISDTVLILNKAYGLMNF